MFAVFCQYKINQFCSRDIWDNGTILIPYVTAQTDDDRVTVLISYYRGETEV